jgi:N-acetylneuraminic acid mutarotase
VKYSIAGTIYLKATSGTLTAACSNVIAVTDALATFTISPTAFAPSATNSTSFVVGARYFSEMVRLNDGNVLITGGRTASGATAVVDTATLYNPTTNRLTGLAPMGVKRVGHTMTVLSNGKVIVIGGMIDNTSATTSVQIYNPTTQKWSTGASLAAARANHTATLLNSGKIFVTGGFDGTARLQSTALYDPPTDSWETGPALASKRGAHGAAKLADGKVLVVGGNDDTATRLSTAEIYDPATHTFTATGSLTTGREEFGQPIFVTAAEAGAATYPQGAVFVGGGYDGTNILAIPEIYNVSTGTWAVGNTGTHLRRYPAWVKLADGKIWAAGGQNANTPDQTSQTQYFDVSTGNWTSRASLTGMQGLAKRAKSPAVLLANGNVFIFGGVTGATETPLPYSYVWSVTGNSWSFGPTFGIPVNIGFVWKLANGKVMSCGGALNNVANTPTRTCEYYDPATNQFIDAPWMNVARHRYDFAQLPDGRVVVAGGAITSTENVLRDVEVFDPATETWTVKGNAPSYAMNRAAFLHIGGNKILSAGGQGGAATTDTGILSTTYVYDADADTWTAGAALPQTLARSRYVMTPANRIFVSGGWNGTAVTDTLYEYNRGTTTGVDDSWTTLTASGTAQSWQALAYYELGGTPYLASMGGNGGYANTTNITTVKIYNITAGTWATGVSLPVKRSIAGAIVQNGKIIVFPGWGAAATNTIYEYTPGTTPGTNDSIATLAPNAGATRCNSMGNETILDDGRLYIHGGVCNTSSWTQAAEVYSRVSTQAISASGGDKDYTYSLFSGVGTLYPKLKLFVPPFPLPATGTQSVIRVQDGIGGSDDSTATYP